jgi:hypothetical protein
MTCQPSPITINHHNSQRKPLLTPLLGVIALWRRLSGDGGLRKTMSSLCVYRHYEKSYEGSTRQSCHRTLPLVSMCLSALREILWPLVSMRGRHDIRGMVGSLRGGALPAADARHRQDSWAISTSHTKGHTGGHRCRPRGGSDGSLWSNPSTEHSYYGNLGFHEQTQMREACP